MSPELIIAIIGGIAAVSGFVFFIVSKLPKRLKAAHYTRKWRDIQKLCAQQENWRKALLQSDDLLDEVMKKKRTSGKSMGERMVTCQEKFTSNDEIWRAHKLANHIRSEESFVPDQALIKDSLISYRQALRDMGAL